MRVKGVVKYNSLGLGTWTLVSDTGEVYELYKPPGSICQHDLRVEVDGIIRDDIMTIAMVGKVLEVQITSRE